VQWSPTGDRYAVVVHSTVTIYDAASSEVLSSEVHTLKVKIVNQSYANMCKVLAYTSACCKCCKYSGIVLSCQQD
jgi:hypothetical protein